MLHLAQVQQDTHNSGIILHLLAAQTGDEIWSVQDRDSLAIEAEKVANTALLSAGRLVLVDLDESQQILSLQDATKWVLAILKKLSTESGSESLGEEQAAIEQWRQELTLQSQDMTRRNLEIETRREQIQDLEKSLKEEKEQIELRLQELEAREAALQKNN
ncbi:MAG: hypothetical protein SAJ12_07855 [Jaaginema sp. PMC 1079.18]|nr:hypothetical protein [Jaaginema sp. PMC 1080.18]MEC4850912.1 hypothetical protein [Jaaginema sp. PMC 1079.18]MEC4865559.1 hypothetical protein [Jaaginema sp. PMC 1078.18]